MGYAISFYITLAKLTCVICFRSGFRVSVRVKVSYCYWIREGKGGAKAETMLDETWKNE